MSIFLAFLTGGAIWDWSDQALWKDADRTGPDGKPVRVLAYGGDWDDFPNQGNDCANGILTGGLKSAAGGVAAALFFSLCAALFSKSRDK